MHKNPIQFPHNISSTLLFPMYMDEWPQNSVMHYADKKMKKMKIKFSVWSQQSHTLAIYDDTFAANVFHDCINLTLKSSITCQLESLATAV